MFGDSAERPRTAPISSATETSSELKIERIAGSDATIRSFHELLIDRRRNLGRRLCARIEGENRRTRARTVGAGQPHTRFAGIDPAGRSGPLPRQLLGQTQPDDSLTRNQIPHEGEQLVDMRLVVEEPALPLKEKWALNHEVVTVLEVVNREMADLLVYHVQLVRRVVPVHNYRLKQGVGAEHSASARQRARYRPRDLARTRKWRPVDNDK